MVEVGTVEVKGELKDTGIDAGLSRIESKLSDIQSKVDSSSGSFEILSKSTASVAKNLITIGTAGTAGLIALASSAPAVADEMANIQNSMREISFGLGEIFEPVFGAVAADLQDVSGALQGNISSIQNLIPEGSMMAIGAAAGFATFGAPGLFFGAALGYAAGNATELAASNVGAVVGGFAEDVVENRQSLETLEDIGISPGVVDAASLIKTIVEGITSVFNKLSNGDAEIETEGGFTLI